MFFFSFDL